MGSIILAELRPAQSSTPDPPRADHDLTDAIPAALDMAIPRGLRTPATTAAIAWHQCDRTAFEIGRGAISIPGTDQTIGIYVLMQ